MAMAEDVDRYADANQPLHLSIYDRAHTPALVETMRDVRNRRAPFRHAQFLVMGRPSASWDEHDRVVQAIIARDAGAVAAATAGIA